MCGSYKLPLTNVLFAASTRVVKDQTLNRINMYSEPSWECRCCSWFRCSCWLFIEVLTVTFHWLGTKLRLEPVLF